VCALSLTCPPDPEKDGANDTTLLGKTRAAKVKKNIKKKDAPAKKKASDKAALAKRRAPSKAGSKAGSKPTLHIYDHCPFCIRAELVMGLNGVKYTRTLYGYGDSLGDSKGKYEGGRVLTGKKQLPVLERAGHPLLPESGDIIEAIEWEVESKMPGKSGRAELEEFFGKTGKFKELQRILTRGQVIKMTDLMDWAKPEDVQYAKEKYEKEGFNYEEAAAAAHKAGEEMETLLKELEGMLKSDTSFDASGEIGMDDIMYLPELRTLSCAPGLKWPKKLKAYVISSFKKAKVKTYF